MATLQRALTELLRDRGQAVTTEYDLSLSIAELYVTKTYQGEPISIRKDYPERRDITRAIGNLRSANIIGSDKDFHKDLYRVVIAADSPAEEVACLADPFIYISHLSAMQRYGLTERNPIALTLSRPARGLWRRMALEKARADLGLERAQESEAPKWLEFPEVLRSRRLRIHELRHPGAWQQVRGQRSRVATIGQTFADMLTRPQWCGGMAHVLSVWSEHARTYLDEIVRAVDVAQNKLVKIRAGYILDELLQLEDDRALTWLQHAQRGGSRVLDPSQPYKPTYSEKWMISLNADNGKDN